MKVTRSQTASHSGRRRHDLGAAHIGASPETGRVTAFTSVQGTGCDTLNLKRLAKLLVPEAQPA